MILRKYTPVEFTIIKSRAMTLSRSPQCRAVMDEKSSPLFPVGGGGGVCAEVTNDWCIISTFSFYNCIIFSGPNTFNENETIAKYEIMDGAPVRGKTTINPYSCL